MSTPARSKYQCEVRSTSSIRAEHLVRCNLAGVLSGGGRYLPYFSPKVLPKSRPQGGLEWEILQKVDGETFRVVWCELI